jgi:two-component system, LytTR family, response regulator
MRVVIVDDEELARARLRRLLAAHADVEVVGELGDAHRALTELPALRPDLALLDIRMPRHDGLELAAAIGDPRCAIVFVTAWADHAVAAFDAAATDYLVKPVDGARLARALDRVRDRRRDADAAAGGTSATAAASPVPDPTAAVPRIAIRDRGRIAFVALADVDAAVARGNYVELHAGPARHIVRTTLADFERRLDPGGFVRIHRSVVLRISRIATIEPLFHGEYLITLATGASFTSARGHRTALRRALGL